MQSFLSPKDLALIIGVSESSLKRWVDDGRVVAIRTAGGHRRIALHEAVRFIRATGASIVRPELLGIPDLTEAPISALNRRSSEAALLEALLAGNAEQSRGLILAHHLTTRSLAPVCDGPITYSMHRIGELWRHDERGIAIEHRATTICLEALHQVRLLLPPVADDAPVAVGAAISTDPYTLPTLMASTCLQELGCRDINLGPDTPVESIVQTAVSNRARFVWLSVSSHAEGFDLDGALRRLAAGLDGTGARLLLGGRIVYGMPVPELPGTHVLHSMSELAAFVRASLATAPAHH